MTGVLVVPLAVVVMSGPRVIVVIGGVRFIAMMRVFGVLSHRTSSGPARPNGRPGIYPRLMPNTNDTGTKGAGKQESGASEKVQGPASYFPSIEKKYGRPIEEWKTLIRSSDLTKHMEIVNWLKAEYGMGHGHANALVAHTLSEDAPSP